MTPATVAPPAGGAAEPAWIGGDVTSRATCVLAPNPGAMTLEGTNTWVLMEPGATDCVVVDPGPLDEQHLQRVLAVVAGRGARVALTLLTHGHPDHAESAWRFAALTGAPVRAVGNGHDELAAYLLSLQRIEAMTGSREVTRILPGHGPTVSDAAAVVHFYREHRQDRLEQVRAAVASGMVGADAVVEVVYADVPRELWPAARLSVLAQLDYLAVSGRGA